MYTDLANVLATNFTQGNKVLSQLANFYNSCIAAQMMTDSEYVDQFLPVIRKFYQDLGMLSLVMVASYHFTQYVYLLCRWVEIGEYIR